MQFLIFVSYHHQAFYTNTHLAKQPAHQNNEQPPDSPYTALSMKIVFSTISFSILLLVSVATTQQSGAGSRRRLRGKNTKVLIRVPQPIIDVKGIVEIKNAWKEELDDSETEEEDFKSLGGINNNKKQAEDGEQALESSWGEEEVHIESVEKENNDKDSTEDMEAEVAVEDSLDENSQVDGSATHTEDEDSGELESVLKEEDLLQLKEAEAT